MPFYLLFLLLGSMFLGGGIFRWWYTVTPQKITKEKRGKNKRTHYINGDLLWIGIKETVKGVKEK